MTPMVTVRTSCQTKGDQRVRVNQQQQLILDQIDERGRTGMKRPARSYVPGINSTGQTPCGSLELSF